MRRLGVDWREELGPHLRRAAGMLGRVTSPHRGPMDDHLREAARAVGAESTYGPVPLAIHFGRPGVTEPDPFFGGEGPERTGCRLCGECLLGCPYGAKNQLTRNYLHLAERYGAEIRPEQRGHVASRPLPGGGYELRTRHPWRSRRGAGAPGAPGGAGRRACSARSSCCSGAATSSAPCRASPRSSARTCAPTARPSPRCSSRRARTCRAGRRSPATSTPTRRPT